MSEELHRTTVFLTGDQRNQLRRISYEEDTPVSELIRRGIELLLKTRQTEKAGAA